MENDRLTNFYIWTLPLVFTIHSIEEIFTIENFLQADLHGAGIPPCILRVFTVSSIHLAISALLILIIIIYVCFLATRENNKKSHITAYIIIVAVQFINSGVHSIEGMVIWSYVPGLWTSLILVPAYSIIAILKIRTIYELRISNIIWFLIIGTVMQIPLALLAYGISIIFV